MASYETGARRTEDVPVRANYFYDKTRDIYRNREKDRKTIVGKLLNEDMETSGKTADFIISNLNRYAESNKKLSFEGYRTLEKYWSKIVWNNAESDTHEIIQARNYLTNQRENHRRNLNMRARALSAQTDSCIQRTERPQPKYVEKEVVPEKKDGFKDRVKRFAGGIMSRLRW